VGAGVGAGIRAATCTGADRELRAGMGGGRRCATAVGAGERGASAAATRVATRARPNFGAFAQA
jgi:hypothetical protein